MYQELVELGAQAKAAGREQSDNPMFAAEVPALSSPGFGDWSAKLLAWDRGWKMEPAA